MFLCEYIFIYGITVTHEILISLDVAVTVTDTSCKLAQGFSEKLFKIYQWSRFQDSASAYRSNVIVTLRSPPQRLGIYQGKRLKFQMAVSMWFSAFSFVAHICCQKFFVDQTVGGEAAPEGSGPDTLHYDCVFYHIIFQKDMKPYRTKLSVRK